MSRHGLRFIRPWLALTLVACVALPETSRSGQPVPQRIMKQDSTLNHLVAPPGYRTARLGTLGRVDQFGAGPQAVVVIPGLGFGGDVFADFAAPRGDRFTLYAVTLPGFGGTPAPPAPPESVSFGAQTWTHAALAAIDELIVKEGIERPIVVGHWMTGTQLALRLALARPDRVKAVIILAGTTRFTPTDTSRMPARPKLEYRVAGIDRFMAPRWFKTVTRETWDDNNFLPSDYAVHTVRGLRLWREAARPPLHVWVRYLCEFYAQDVSLELGKLEVPTLVLLPGLEGVYQDPGNEYMAAYCHAGLDGDALTNSRITIRTIPDSRVFMWYDQPDRVDREIESFVSRLPR